MEGAEIANRYRNDILRPIVQPYRQNFEEEFVFARVFPYFPYNSTGSQNPAYGCKAGR